METIEVTTASHEAIFDALVEMASDFGKSITFLVNGRKTDRLTVANSLPNDELSPEHQSKVDRMFSKRQFGYRRTACNLVHRRNQMAQARHARENAPLMLEMYREMHEMRVASELRKAEKQVRTALASKGYTLKKTPAKHKSRELHGIGYMVVENERNLCVLGSTHWPYDATLLDVKAFLQRA